MYSNTVYKISIYTFLQTIKATPKKENNKMQYNKDGVHAHVNNNNKKYKKKKQSD